MPSGSPDGIQGKWQGKWQSTYNSHKGSLWCILTKIDDSTYQTRYRASYLKIFRFEYALPVRVEKIKDVYHFSGEADLGKMYGGQYSYKGRIEGSKFNASYSSKADQGWFEMTLLEE